METCATACTPTGPRRGAGWRAGAGMAGGGAASASPRPALPSRAAVWHACLTRPSPLPPTSPSPASQADKVIAEKTRLGRAVFLVKWRGLGYADATWEDARDLRDDAVRVLCVCCAVLYCAVLCCGEGLPLCRQKPRDGRIAEQRAPACSACSTPLVPLLAASGAHSAVPAVQPAAGECGAIGGLRRLPGCATAGAGRVPCPALCGPALYELPPPMPPPPPVNPPALLHHPLHPAVPTFCNGRTLRDYQLASLQWNISNWWTQTNCILGDEVCAGGMVLGEQPASRPSAQLRGGAHLPLCPTAWPPAVQLVLGGWWGAAVPARGRVCPPVPARPPSCPPADGAGQDGAVDFSAGVAAPVRPRAGPLPG